MRQEEGSLRRPMRNSEGSTWRQCKLKWYLSFVLGFASHSINPNFWLGELVHHCLSWWYLGLTDDPAAMFYIIGSEMIEQERGQQIVIDGTDLGYNELAELEAYLALGTEMLEGWQEWDAANRDFDVLDSELSYYVELTDNEGRPFTFVGRFDLLTENTDGIRVGDFKTAADFGPKKNIEMDQQFRRYPWLVRQAHPEWAGDVIGSMWLALRKMAPVNNPRSKPPYFDRALIDLTSEEFAEVERELLAEATDILRCEERIAEGEDPRLHIYPSPQKDCTWRCDFYKNGLCAVWRSGRDDLRDFGLLHGTWDNDPYAEYKEDHVTAIETFGRTEAGAR